MRVSQVAPRAVFPQYGVWVIRGNGRLPLIGPIGEVALHCSAEFPRA